MESRVDNAFFVMQEAHKGQKRWDGSNYSKHPIDVVARLADMGIRDEEIMCAGYLHDVIEDTSYSYEQIKSNFGERVMNIVEELTFDQGGEEYYWERCRKMSKDASIIKIADILSNLGDTGKKSDNFTNKRIVALQILMGNIL